MERLLTIEEAWDKTLTMYKYVSDNFTSVVYDDVDELKEEWLYREGYDKYIKADCFFCEYSKQNGNEVFDYGRSCINCPAKLVDESFECDHEDYSFIYKPAKFYEKLIELNEKRKAKNG